jgi:hypothetical protein
VLPELMQTGPKKKKKKNRDLYRCTVLSDINVYVHKPMQLFITKIYIKIQTKMLLHVSVCDHHQGGRT